MRDAAKDLALLVLYALEYAAAWLDDLAERIDRRA